jgi:hypothetical protein
MMSSAIYEVSLTRPYNVVAPAEPDELFPQYIKKAYTRLEYIAKSAGNKLSPEVVAWAKEVMLRVLPRHYLLTAEIDHFDGEIHVNWEYGKKRVTVFLPAPHQVKIYREETTDQGTQHRLSPQADNPWEIKGVLRWLFTPDM